MKYILGLFLIFIACGSNNPIAPQLASEARSEVYSAWLGVHNKILDSLYLFFKESPEDYNVLFEHVYISNAQRIVPPGKAAFVLAASFTDSIQTISGYLFALQRNDCGRIYFYRRVPEGWTLENYPSPVGGLILYSR